MIQKILISLLFVVSIVVGQKKHSPVFIEHNSILNSSQLEYISYRIPFDQLLFVKNGNGYKASFTIIFEIYKDDSFVKRNISKKEGYTENYEDTKSGEIYFEDLISFDLEPDDYLLKPTLAIGSTELDIKLPELKLHISDFQKENIYSPVIVNNKVTKQKGYLSFELTNLQNYIPFSPEKFALLIGIKDTSITTINIEILKDEMSILKKQVSKMFDGNLSLTKVNSINVFADSSSHPNGYFLVNDFSHQLEEGKIEVLVKIDSTEKKFPLEVYWQNKPKVLNDAEYSIKLLSYIEDADVVRSLLQGDEEDYYNNLLEYWTEHFPTKLKYNFAIEEYYSRADYAIKNLSSLKSKKGAESDRGKIYITYGKPNSIDRNYNERNEIIEVWEYEKINRTFVFKDITGTGKYTLVKE